MTKPSEHHKTQNAEKMSRYISRRSVVELEHIRHALETEGTTSLSLAEVLDAVLDAHKKGSQKLAINRRWTLEKAFALFSKQHGEIAKTDLDSETAKLAYKFLQAKAEETERAIELERESAETRPTSPPKSRAKRVQVPANDGATQETAQTEETRS